MALYTSQFTPFSAFYSSRSFSDQFSQLRRNPFVSKSPSIAYHRSSKYTDDIINRLDRIDILGGEGEDMNGDQIGHTGCVNALAWSQSGHCLATGSDDRKIILWKMGSSDEHPGSYNNNNHLLDNRGYPHLDMAQTDVIETGHRANIFNVKWAPHCSDQRLLSCAGDSQIRVFDLSKSSASVDQRLGSGKEYKLWEDAGGACTRILRCHSGRAKKISTENSPDVFLTAAEDGEVRQTDLRVSHTCSKSQSYGQGCPRPLMQFKMELYSISVSIQEPWLFAIAGTSDKIYLQDRRMIPRLLKSEFGAYIDNETAALTHCVRRFCRESKVGEGEQSFASRLYGRSHVTAVKISEANGRDLLASYSGDGVYRFDIKGEPGSAKREEVSMLHSSKRRKTSSGSATPQAEDVNSNDLETLQPEIPTRTDSTAPQPEPMSPEVVSIRKTIFMTLFNLENEANLFRRLAVSNRNKAVYEQLLRGLEILEGFIPESWIETNVDQHTLEEGTIAFCRLIIYVDRNTAGGSEPEDLNLESSTLRLPGALTRSAHDTLIPMIEDLQEANWSRNRRKKARLRFLLMKRAERYLRLQWAIDGYSRENESGEGGSESDVEVQQQWQRRISQSEDHSNALEDYDADMEGDLNEEKVEEGNNGDEDGSETSQSDELASPEAIAARRRVFMTLFHSATDFTAEIFTRLKQDLNLLTELIPDAEQWNESNEDRCVEEEGTIAFCNLLLYIKRSTNGLNELVELQLDSHKSSLLGLLTRFGHDKLIPVIEELQKANRDGVYEEEIRLRQLLWDSANKYIKSQWEIDGYTRDDYILGEIPGGFDARLAETMVLDRLEALEYEDDYTDDDEEDDDDDSDDDDQDSLDRFSESADEQEIDRHGISGGDAPFVFPNGCFTGHANNETVKDCGSIGANDEYIWSGSDSGHLFIWKNDNKRRLMGIWKGDHSVVKALSAHPILPICAVSGIDDSVKIFGPLSHGSKSITNVTDLAEEIIFNNSHQQRVGFNPQRIRQMFARQMDLSQVGGAAADWLENEAEDCTVM